MKPGSQIKTFITKKGKSAVIRSLKESDVEDLLAYANNLIREDTFVMLSGKKLTRAHERKYVREALKQIEKNNKVHIVVEVEDKFAGSCEIRMFDRRKSHVGEIGISMSSQFRGEGIGTVCMQTLIDLAKKCKLKLLYLHCFENNTHARKLYEKVGFRLAGIVPCMYSWKGQYFGEV